MSALGFLKKGYDLLGALDNPQTTGQKIASALWDIGKYGANKHLLPHLNPLAQRQHSPEEMARRASEFANVSAEGEPENTETINIPFKG